MSEVFGSENSSPDATQQSSSFSDSIRDLLSANETNSGFMYPEFSVPDTAPQASAAAHDPYASRQGAYSPDVQHLTQALQYERAQNEQLAERAKYLASIEEFLAKDPVSANRAIQYLNTGSLGDEPPPTAGQQYDNVPSSLKKQIGELQTEVRYMTLKNQSAELEREYPGVYQAVPVAQYMAKHGFSNLKDAFHHLLGNSMGEIIRAQQMQQYQQQQQAWQQYQQQYQRQAPSQSQYPAPYTTPPPAANDHSAVVLRPGAGLVASDPMDNVKPKSWKEAEALVFHDMKRAGFAV